MRILWIVNTIFPYPASKIGKAKSCFGGWLNGMADSLKGNKNIKLFIATVYEGKEILNFNDGEIEYYLIPGAPATKYNKKLESYWKIIDDKVKPDIVHIHGTEYAHGLAFLNANLNRKNIVSIQGLIHRYADVYLGNMSNKDIIRNITFRNIIKQDNIYQCKKKFEKRGLIEKEIIKKADVIVGRTTWDYANVKAINPEIKYFIGNETLRSSFYNQQWNIDKIDKYTLFSSQANYPIKGFHYLIQTVDILKYKYPQIKLYVGGVNIIDDSTIKAKMKRTDYARYIKKLIRKYNLEKNIIFTGMLDEEEMLKRLLTTHVFVLPSTIENSSNSLGEAMLIGMPCVASNSGGSMDILEHKKEGFLYPYTEPAMCAEYISKFFENDDLAIRYGKQAQITAIERHNSYKNVKEMLRIYQNIIKE